jgi:16S rRNA (cytosine967-C5)-methyltransferase
VRPPGDDLDTGQAGAINRSRPIYDTGPRGRGPGARRGPDGRRGPGVRRGPDDRRGADFRPAPAGRRGPGPRRNGAPAPGFEEREPPPLPSNPREAALRILHAADTRSAFSDRLLEGAHERGGPDPRDMGLMHELVKGTLRWRGRIDWALDRLVHIGLGQTQPWVRNILRLGAYQLMFLDRVPAHAAVDESVKLAHKYSHPGAAGLVNSVLRRLAEEKATLEPPPGDDAESLALWGSHPRWIVERWLARFGVEATRALLLADNRPVPVGLRVNALRGTRAQLIERLAAEDVAARPAALAPDLVWVEGGHAPAALKAFKEGWCTVQDESEALVGRLVGPQPHERLLDLCAAPGGKCTHLAELIGDEGDVWAMDRVESRVKSLEATVERLGTHSIHVVQGDGRHYPFPMPFDRVLVDAPCSGLGVLGRRADARWRKGPEILREMPPVQLELLAGGGRHLRPGGVLVYSVCSFEPEETTQVVERFLRANPAFVLEDAQGAVPDAVLDGQGCMTTLPHVHGCDGAFAARFRRI